MTNKSTVNSIVNKIRNKYMDISMLRIIYRENISDSVHLH